jgi:purine nucleoside phosphorylase
MKIGLLSGTVPIEAKVTEKKVTTKWGEPSSSLRFFKLGGNEFVHISRHGIPRTIPPHKINNKANMAALKACGVTKVLGISSAGVISKKIKLGTLVVPNDFISLGRETFFDNEICHVSLCEPFCPALRNSLIMSMKDAGLAFDEGVVISTRGPSFETAAEIRAYGKLGADLVNMTIGQEAVLAKELGLCYASICTADNYAVGIVDNVDFAVVQQGAKTSAVAVKKVLEALTLEGKCECADAPQKGKAI